jgi:hypothetical protein
VLYQAEPLPDNIAGNRVTPLSKQPCFPHEKYNIPEIRAAHAAKIRSEKSDAVPQHGDAKSLSDFRKSGCVGYNNQALKRFNGPGHQSA